MVVSMVEGIIVGLLVLCCVSTFICAAVSLYLVSLVKGAEDGAAEARPRGEPSSRPRGGHLGHRREERGLPYHDALSPLAPFAG